MFCILPGKPKFWKSFEDWWQQGDLYNQNNTKTYFDFSLRYYGCGNKFYPNLFDQTSDASNKGQLSLCPRYLGNCCRQCYDRTSANSGYVNGLSALILREDCQLLLVHHAKFHLCEI